LPPKFLFQAQGGHSFLYIESLFISLPQQLSRVFTSESGQADLASKSKKAALLFSMEIRMDNSKWNRVPF
jgi:hypothetical protein